MVEVPGAIARALRRRAGPDAFAVGLTLPGIAFVAVLGLWPLAAFIAGSFEGTAGPSLAAYRRLLSDDLFATVALRTVLVACCMTAVTTLLAYPAAYALARARGWGKTLLIALVALPYLTSVLVRVYAWAALLAVNGPVNKLLVATGALHEPALLGHSLIGTGIGIVHILCPIAVLTLWSQLEKIDRAQETVAASLGASRVEAFLTVFLPQSVPGIAAAGTLVYVLALGAYVIPATLGGTKGLLFAQLVVDQATQLLDWEVAGAMGLLMLFAAAAPLVVWRLVRIVAKASRRRDRPRRLARGVVLRGLVAALSPMPHLALRTAASGAAGAVLAFLIVPELVVLLFSFGPPTRVTLPPETLTLAGYRAVLTDPTWLVPAQRSLAYAAADAVLATLLGTAAAYGFARGPAGWARTGQLLLLAPLVLPEIITAISYFIFATKAQLAGTDLGIVLGQAVGVVGLVAVVVGAVMRGLDPALEQAALACGASRPRMLRDIVVPLIAPGILVGALYAFLNAFDNLVTPLFIAGTKATVTVRMFLSMQEQLTSAPAVVASVLILALAAGLLTGLVAWPGARTRLGPKLR